MKKPGASRAPGQGKKDKEGIMMLTTDCYIIPSKSQKDLADNRKPLLAGVVMATCLFLFKLQITPEPWRWTTKGFSRHP